MKPLAAGCTARLLRRRAYHPSGRLAEPGDTVKVAWVGWLAAGDAPPGEPAGAWAVWLVAPEVGCSSLFGKDTACAPACEVEVVHAAGECACPAWMLGHGHEKGCPEAGAGRSFHESPT